MYRSTDWTELRTVIMKQGALVVPDFLDRTTIEDIERELEPWRRQVNFNEIYGSTILAPTAGCIIWASSASPPCASRWTSRFSTSWSRSSASRDPLAGQLPGEIRPDPNHLKMHSDFDGGILVFYYLSGVDDELGSTRYLPETHEIGASLQTRETVFIDESPSSRAWAT